MATQKRDKLLTIRQNANLLNKCLTHFNMGATDLSFFYKRNACFGSHKYTNFTAADLFEALLLDYAEKNRLRN